MKISTKGRYGMRLMVELGLAYEGKPVSLRDIAKRQEISEKYLEQIVTRLGKPSQITVGDILRVTEGSLTPVACLDDDECTRRERCATYSVWSRVQEAVTKVVDQITLQELVDDYRRKNEEFSPV